VSARAFYGDQKTLVPIAPWGEPMQVDVIEARALDGYRLHLRFSDRTEGEEIRVYYTVERPGTEWGKAPPPLRG